MLEMDYKTELTCLLFDNPCLQDAWMPTDPLCCIALSGHIPQGALYA